MVIIKQLLGHNPNYIKKDFILGFYFDYGDNSIDWKLKHFQILQALYVSMKNGFSCQLFCYKNVHDIWKDHKSFLRIKSVFCPILLHL